MKEVISNQKHQDERMYSLWSPSLLTPSTLASSEERSGMSSRTSLSSCLTDRTQTPRHLTDGRALLLDICSEQAFTASD